MRHHLSKTYTKRVFKFLYLPVVLRQNVRDFGALGSGGVLGAFVREVDLPSNPVKLVLVGRSLSIQLETGPVALANHIGQLQVLCVKVFLHPLHFIDGLLRRVSLELELLELGQHVQVLRPQLAVELREGFVLVPPRVDLVLQLFDQFILGSQL